MEKSIKRITNIVLIVLTAVAVVAAFIIPFTAKESASREMSLNIGSIMLYILAIDAIVLIIVFAVAQVISNKKQLLKTLILLAIVAVIVLVSYLLAPSDLSEVAALIEVSESVYKWIGAAINVAYVAFAGVILALAGSLIYTKIKK
jgi:hypothetical protein